MYYKKEIALLGLLVSSDYVGNLIYQDKILKTILTDNGYIENGMYYFYVRDHLGNNRVVANASGGIVQSTQYYPFGMAFAEGSGTEQGKQPYKYNGKELDRTHELNWYDYSARQMDNAYGRFTSVDPLAEKYYSISPYAYVLNNPLKYIDINGMDTTYVNRGGDELARIPGGEDVIFPTADDVVVTPDSEQSNFSIPPFLGNSVGVGGTVASTYSGLRYTERMWGGGYFQTAKGNYYSLSALQPNAAGKYVKGVQGLRYGALYAQKSVKIPARIGTGLAYFSLGISGINFYNDISLRNGIDVGFSALGIAYWEAAVPYTYFQLVGQPNIKQIQENIKTNQNPLNNTVNPTTGDYYAPGYFDGFGF